MMTDIAGKTHSLYQSLETHNKVVLVFWSSWCKFCRELLPELALFEQVQNDNALRIFALNIWEDRDAVSYLDSRNIHLTTMLNAEGLAERFQIRGTPGIIVIDQNKQEVYRYSSDESIIDAMRSLQRLALSP
ncbi:TlpA family protein disulfide reductase [Teredinibacter waterburyi]|uniref:TlpA family protein disulfide reductase n=1 Tax=Teredinibacter waterburyi TaxID=1500538 RepID=UPI00165F66CA|nr:TlpA disulfide reductase family protein [Teredinibacter waterburyi]